MFPSCASFWLYLVQFCLYLRGIVISLMCNCHCHSFCFLCVLLSFVHCLLVGTSHYSSGPQLFHPIAEPTTLPLSSTPCRYCRRQSSQKGCCPPHGSLSCQDRSWSHNSQLWSNNSTISLRTAKAPWQTNSWSTSCTASTCGNLLRGSKSKEKNWCCTLQNVNLDCSLKHTAAGRWTIELFITPYNILPV